IGNCLTDLACVLSQRSQIWQLRWLWLGSGSRSDDQSYELIASQHHDAEHQMAEHLGRTTHAHRSAAAVVLEVGVDALGRASLVVAHVLSGLIAGIPLGPRLRLGDSLATAPRIGLDDRHMPERSALFPDLR